MDHAAGAESDQVIVKGEIMGPRFVCLVQSYQRRLLHYYTPMFRDAKHKATVAFWIAKSRPVPTN